jgi:hypothetical protein
MDNWAAAGNRHADIDDISEDHRGAGDLGGDMVTPSSGLVALPSMDYILTKGRIDWRMQIRVKWLS